MNDPLSAIEPLSIQRVRRLMVVYALLLVFDGALRKWVLPDWSNSIFVAKDAILAVAYVFALSSPYRQSEGLRTANAFVLAMLGLFIVLWLRDATTLRGLAGLKYYIACLPLAFLVPYALRGGDLDRFAWLMLRLTALVCLLGVVQYMSPPDSAINRYAWRISSESDISAFAVEDSLSDAIARVRITGTFSYISPMAAFLQTMVPLLWVMIIKEQALRRRIQLGVILALLVTALLMNGSRAPLLIGAVISIPFAITAIRRGAGPMLLSIGAAVAVALIGWSVVFSEAYENFAYRAADTYDAPERISGFLLGPILTMEDFGLVGLGMGSAFGGGTELADVRDNQYQHDDIEHDKVGVELGAVVYLFLIGIKLWLLAATARLLFRVDRSRVVFLWILFSLAVQAESGPSIPFHNSVAAAAYFFAVGLFFYLRMQAAASSLHAPAARIVPRTSGAVPG